MEKVKESNKQINIESIATDKIKMLDESNVPDFSIRDWFYLKRASKKNLQFITLVK